MPELTEVISNHDFEYATIETWDWNVSERQLRFRVCVPISSWYWRRRINFIRNRLGFTTARHVMRELEIHLNGVHFRGEDPMRILLRQNFSLPLEVESIFALEDEPPKRLTMKIEGVAFELDFTSGVIKSTEIDDARFF